jgi:hypothetical protein
MTTVSKQNPFAGAWNLNTRASTFDKNHHPKAGLMRIDVAADGWVVITAEGLDEHGQRCVEKPNRLNPDGRGYPLPDFPGLVVTTTRPDAATLRTECRRQDGSIVGAGTFAVSPDGRTLTATTSGWDSQLREFQQTTHWERQEE